jgi:hypothetical protein
VRGCDIDAWHADTPHKVIFCHDDRTGSYSAPPKRAARYLREHITPEARGRLGALQHIGTDVDTVKVAWHDLANTMKAVVLPARARCLGGCRPLIPLNTVYYIPVAENDAHLLAAYFNSLPVRVFARAIAERAKDAHFRFFACTIGKLPLPAAWRTRSAGALTGLSRQAHTAGAIDDAAQHELDRIVADNFGLSAAAMNAFRRFDQWLKGEAE